MNADYSENNLKIIVAESSSYRQVLRKLGKNAGGGAWAWVKNRINQYKIDVSHFDCYNIKSGNRREGQNKKKNAIEILVDNQTRTCRERTYQLKRALLEIGRIYECEVCGQKPIWNNEKLTLQIDHINRNWKDCREDNLRFICPNCHSQF